MRQTMQSIPNGIIEAGRIDGASSCDLLEADSPSDKATLSALAIFTFMGQWNSFVAPDHDFFAGSIPALGLRMFRTVLE